MLRPEPGGSLLDVGCGTGYFTRLFARDVGGSVIGLDPNEEWLSYARAHETQGERYLSGRAETLPFPDRSFDYTISITSLCFMSQQEQALRELVRVTRRRFALGLLNRHSLLYLQKGRRAGAGAYRGAHWHTAAEVRTLFAALPVGPLATRTAVLLPQGDAMARAVEHCWPGNVLLGAFLVVAGDAMNGQRP
ncbi:MAG: class I SAM-dependent methyltransferase [Gammaproteobacteria bacterium]|nr:class I SAM-dependent methyltransferase [Gammaproteobacteria bacterium]